MLFRSDTSIIIKYELLPLVISPHIKVFGLSASSKIAAKTIADLATLWLHSEEKLSFEIKIPNKIESSLSSFFPTNDIKRIAVNKDNKDWYLDLEYKMSDIKITRFLSLNPPAFIKTGIWLSFNIENEPRKYEAIPSQIPPMLGFQLSELNAIIDERVNKYVEEFHLSKPNNYLWINKNVIASLFNDLSLLKSEDRQVTLRSVKKSGYVLKKEWNHGIIGKGELSARFEDDDPQFRFVRYS